MLERAGFLPGDFQRLIGLLRHFKLPTHLPPNLGVDAILQSAGRDKKFEADEVRFVLATKIGEAILSRPGQVTVADLRGKKLASVAKVFRVSRTNSGTVRYPNSLAA